MITEFAAGGGMLSVVREDKDGTGEICTEPWTRSSSPSFRAASGRGVHRCGPDHRSRENEQDEVGSICKFPFEHRRRLHHRAAVGVEIGI